MKNIEGAQSTLDRIDKKIMELIESKSMPSAYKRDRLDFLYQYRNRQVELTKD